LPFEILSKLGKQKFEYFTRLASFRCYGVKNRTKWKLRHCNPSINALTWNWLCGGYCASGCQILSKLDKHFLRYCIYHFFKRQRPPSWIFINLTFWTTVMLWIADMCHHAKFHQNWSNVSSKISLMFEYFCGLACKRLYELSRYLG